MAPRRLRNTDTLPAKVRLVGEGQEYAAGDSPARAMQESLLNQTYFALPQDARWPRPVRVLLPILLSGTLWIGIVAWLA